MSELHKDFNEMSDIEKKECLRTMIGKYNERISQLKYEVAQIQAQIDGTKKIRETDVMNGYRQERGDYDRDRSAWERGY